MTNEELKEHCEACFALGVLQGAITVTVKDREQLATLLDAVDVVFERLVKTVYAKPETSL